MLSPSQYVHNIDKTTGLTQALERPILDKRSLHIAKLQLPTRRPNFKGLNRAIRIAIWTVWG